MKNVKCSTKNWLVANTFMSYAMNGLYVGLLFLCFGTSCNQSSNKDLRVTPAFYRWQTNSYDLSETETARLVQAGAKKLYVKFFEVENDRVLGAVPTSKTSFHFRGNLGGGLGSRQDSVLSALQIIPVVYINNNVFKNISDDSISTLASNISFLTEKYFKERISSGTFNELQIDCDWTPSTKENFFRFLTLVKKETSKKISCTLRLYPYKYKRDMGVPPVDRVMLMCYNLNNPLQYEDKNSILESNEVKEYLKGRDEYPLPIDVALPAFSWALYYHNHQFSNLIYAREQDLKPVLRKIKPLWYAVIRDTMVGNNFLRVGDEIKFETADQAEIQKTIRVLEENIKFKGELTVSIFSIDDNTNNKDDSLTVKNIFDSFNR